MIDKTAERYLGYFKYLLYREITQANANAGSFEGSAERSMVWPPFLLRFFVVGVDQGLVHHDRSVVTPGGSNHDSMFSK